MAKKGDEHLFSVLLSPGPRRDMLIRQIVLLVHRECSALCKKKQLPSVLRGLQRQELASFLLQQLDALLFFNS